MEVYKLLWVDAGSPSAGVLLQLKKLAHKRYKDAVRRVGKREHLKNTRMAKVLLDDPNCNFWPEVHQFNCNHKSTPTPVIDSVSGSDNITNNYYMVQKAALQ